MMHTLVRWLSDNFGKLAVLTLATSLGSLVFSLVHVMKALRQRVQKSVREAAAHSAELKHALTSERDQSGTDEWGKQNAPDAPTKYPEVLAPAGQGQVSSPGQSQLGRIGCN